jgi:hypothetical protein
MLGTRDSTDSLGQQRRVAGAGNILAAKAIRGDDEVPGSAQAGQLRSSRMLGPS